MIKIPIFLLYCTLGLYLCGGLTPKNIDLLKDPDGNFMTAFQDKVRTYVPTYVTI